MNGEEIAELRHALEWSQILLSQFMQVTPRTVQYWESGQVKPNLFQQAVFRRLKERIDKANSLGTIQHQEFADGLRKTLIDILFGDGVYVLLTFLFGK